MSQGRERVSLIVPTYNGAHLLDTCLEAVRRQSRAADETIVVDDASSDGTGELLRARFPWVRHLRLERNRGFVGAVNAGIEASSGATLALLNNDTEAEAGWLEALVAPLEEDRQLGSAASKMLLFDRRDHLQSAGDGYSTGGVPINRGAWTPDDGRFDDDVEVFGASGGAAAYRRSALEEAGGFDPWLVSYLEDVDLSWRLQLLGYGCRYVPAARVYHMVSASGGGVRPSYYCGRNFPLVLVSDVPGEILGRYWGDVVREQGRIVLQAMRGWRGEAARARLKGYLAAVREMPVASRRRRRVQGMRRVPVARLERLLTRVTR